MAKEAWKLCFNATQKSSVRCAARSSFLMEEGFAVLHQRSKKKVAHCCNRPEVACLQNLMAALISTASALYFQKDPASLSGIQGVLSRRSLGSCLFHCHEWWFSHGRSCHHHPECCLLDLESSFVEAFVFHASVHAYFFSSSWILVIDSRLSESSAIDFSCYKVPSCGFCSQDSSSGGLRGDFTNYLLCLLYQLSFLVFYSFKLIITTFSTITKEKRRKREEKSQKEEKKREQEEESKKKERRMKKKQSIRNKYN